MMPPLVAGRSGEKRSLQVWAGRKNAPVTQESPAGSAGGPKAELGETSARAAVGWQVPRTHSGTFHAFLAQWPPSPGEQGSLLCFTHGTQRLLCPCPESLSWDVAGPGASLWVAVQVLVTRHAAPGGWPLSL